MTGRIAAHLGIEITRQEIVEIDGRTNREASRKISATLQKGSKAQIDVFSGHRFDSKTLLHANHIDSGKVGRWRDELSEAQVQILNRTFEKWMPLLGYSS
jgi:hypothetical protein